MTKLTNRYEQGIIDVLTNEGCINFETSITPENLVEKCKTNGLENKQAVEIATVELIDKDKIEYEMNDKLETSNLWLLEE